MFGECREGKCDGKALCRLATKWLDYYEEVQAPERWWGKAVTTFFVQVAFNKSSQCPLYYHVTLMECLISGHLFSVVFCWILDCTRTCQVLALYTETSCHAEWSCKVSPTLTLCSHVSATGVQSLFTVLEDFPSLVLWATYVVLWEVITFKVISPTHWTRVPLFELFKITAYWVLPLCPELYRKLHVWHDLI